jgi:hypothetical protein
MEAMTHRLNLHVIGALIERASDGKNLRTCDVIPGSRARFARLEDPCQVPGSMGRDGERLKLRSAIAVLLFASALVPLSAGTASGTEAAVSSRVCHTLSPAC